MFHENRFVFQHNPFESFERSMEERQAEESEGEEGPDEDDWNALEEPEVIERMAISNADDINQLQLYNNGGDWYMENPEGARIEALVDTLGTEIILDNNGNFTTQENIEITSWVRHPNGGIVAIPEGFRYENREDRIVPQDYVYEQYFDQDEFASR